MTPSRVRRPAAVQWAALAAGTLLGLLCLPLAHRAVARPGIHGARVGAGLHILAAPSEWALLGVLAAACFFAAPRRAAMTAIVVLAVALRIAGFGQVAPFSDDLNRYAWDGRVQAHAIDPYRYAPVAPQLEYLRDPGWLWPPHVDPPGQTFVFSKINRDGKHTIYPPVAEAWFLVLHVLDVQHFRDRGFEGVGLVTDLAILAMFLALLRRAGRDPRWLGIWALCPLPVLEVVADAHVDGLAVLFTLPALELARLRRPGWAGVLLGLAVGIKLYPLLVLPAVMSVELVSLRPDSLRRAARSVLGCLGVLVLGYLPHIFVVGTAVVGYLPGYLKEEHYSSGTRYLLLADVGLHGRHATLAVGLVLAATVLLVLYRHPPPMLGATWLYGALLLMTTPVQPWYGVGLAAVGLLAARPEWLLVGLAGYPIYVQTVLAADNAVTVGRISYSVAAVLVAACAVARRSTGHGRDGPPGVSWRARSGRDETVGRPLPLAGMSSP